MQNEPGFSMGIDGRIVAIEWVGEEKPFALSPLSDTDDDLFELCEANVYVRDSASKKPIHFIIRLPFRGELENLIGHYVWGDHAEVRAMNSSGPIIADRLTTKAWEMRKGWADMLPKIAYDVLGKKGRHLCLKE